MAITLKLLKKLLVDPIASIPQAEKQENNTALVMVVLNSILTAIGIGIALNNFQIGLTLLVFLIVASLFAAFLMNIVFKTLESKGNYWDVLKALSFPYFGVSVSILITSLFFKWNIYAAMLVGIILFSLYVTTAISGTFRILKDTSKLDVVTIWVVVSILTMALVITIYLTSILTVLLEFLSPSFFKFF